MSDYLPEVVNTATDLLNVDKGNVFTRSFFPRTSEKRLEVQKEIYTTFLECGKVTSLAKIEAEREIKKLAMEIEQTMGVAQMDYSYKMKTLQLNTVIQFCEKYNLDAETAMNLLSKVL